jgi:RES domain-containing protein
MERVCAKCFEDGDIADFIVAADGEPGCEFCEETDAPTIEMENLGPFLSDRIAQEYGQAVDQLPYETKEGGYQGWHRDSYDMIYDEGIIGLERHSDALLKALVAAIGEDAIWSDWDWLSLDDDEAMAYSWAAFARVVKHGRHFFFQTGSKPDDHDHLTPLTLMARIADLCEKSGLVRTRPVGDAFFRARRRTAQTAWTTPADLGPPRAELATQFNRMNSPGVPALYLSETRALCLAETVSALASVATWKVLRPIRILDLVDVPPRPGLFSPMDRAERLGLRFLHHFVKEVTKPVAGDAVVKLDYIPTQVVTEFLRDWPFAAGRIDGVRYPSATGEAGANLVLFASQRDLVDGSPGDDDPPASGPPWLVLANVEQAP